jgi:predicted RNA binding protein YcfA (HicA-like mRNA interferase family)
VGGSHVVLERYGWEDYVWAFHDREELGSRILAKIARDTGLEPEDL